jgi:HD-like signal output (HDOD) protein
MPAAPAIRIPYPREKLLQIARSLPADLQVLANLGEMLQDVNSELDGIAVLLRRDLALATRIVRISNSASYSSGTRIGSVEEAVNRVGFSEILKLIGTAAAARFAERSLEHYEVSASALRDNMLYCALAAEALARLCGLDARTAYTAGLMRPLGTMVLDRAGRAFIKAGQRFTMAEWQTYSAWEDAYFGINNEGVAALIIEEWRFPAEMAEAIRGHYLKQADDFQSPLSCVLNLANGLAQRQQRALPGEVLWWDITGRKLAGANVTAAQLEQVAEATETAFAAAVAALEA